MVSAITGHDFSSAKLEEIAGRVADLERVFNLEAGLSPGDDTLPDRFFHESITIKNKKTRIPRDAFRKMREEYYLARGWNEEGIPSQDTVSGLKKGRLPSER
jgi:aldehyde:ferredoxin oxidoreductase